VGSITTRSPSGRSFVVEAVAVANVRSSWDGDPSRRHCSMDMGTWRGSVARRPWAIVPKRPRAIWW